MTECLFSQKSSDEKGISLDVLCELVKMFLGGSPGILTNVKWIFDRVLQQTMLAVRAHGECDS